MTFVIFMVLVAAAGTAVYLLFFMSHVPGAAEERWGTLEPLPEGVGDWQRDAAPGADGLLREQRVLSGESMGMSAEKLIVQVRFRDAETKKIERILPEQVVKRRRIRPGE